jgi:hypothetical protein
MTNWKFRDSNEMEYEEVRDELQITPSPKGRMPWWVWEMLLLIFLALEVFPRGLFGP